MKKIGKMLFWQMSAIKPGGSSGRHFCEKLAKTPQDTGLHNKKLESSKHLLGKRRAGSPETSQKGILIIFLMQKTVQATRREVGLNLSVACREKLFKNVRVEGKNRRKAELRK